MMKAVVIVAGGKGLRMGGDVPKQFLPVGGKPVLMRTIDRFLEYDKNMQVVLVLPAAQQEYWCHLCEEYGFVQPHAIADGGETRFHSVKNGLALVNEGTALIGVHDGVRPFVSTKTIGACYDKAASSGAAIPVVPVVETVRHLMPGGQSETVPRDDYRLVQTPQVFDAALLRQAYTQAY
ncbi:MAG: 2-C-methyl-D-erythritol 4-phosphate cytidylyltransferase, partial [Bacteroidales bacterium]|nr:2-C-methyl-D-erythritol 4-phosphate cytidylyltransferase [Bacteroidales bacterium]